ncbi:GNAT family N-acetyltransferase [Streptomyces sp. NPDC049881]|uniref:GNAT family N-acetyltransferase n=1 Tax=Streptomyces sp. NPDC049881 TaxID=3155778 RepID=UPI00344A8EE9
MAERTIFLDPDRHDPRSRKIHVRAYRWFTTVGLDRDAYVDATTSRGGASELPTAYSDAFNRAQNSSTDRIWYDGYPGSFFWSSGPRWLTLYVPFPYIETAIKALRVAELDHDYSGLHAFADRLALPIDDWLAPGERELTRGTDFTPPPGTFLRFLRGKAKERGVRLNGRATPGSVWIRPTLPSAEKQKRERDPDRYPGWADRWTGYLDPDDRPRRPWVGTRSNDLSHGALPVQFRPFATRTDGDCPCGMSLRDLENGSKGHAIHHAAWTFGIRAPKNLEWWDDLAVVTTQSPIAWRKLTYQVARMPQRENQYDFNSWSHLSEPMQTASNVRAYLLQANGYVIGYLAAQDINQHHRWNLIEGSQHGEQDNTLRPCVDLIWVADFYRRQGVGATLVQALADDFGCQVTDVSWSSPLSDAGRRLARRISPEAIWIS